MNSFNPSFTEIPKLPHDLPAIIGFQMNFVIKKLFQLNQILYTTSYEVHGYNRLEQTKGWSST